MGGLERWGLALVLAVGIWIGSSVAFAGEPGGLKLISYASDSGVYSASSGFDAGMRRPKRAVLDVAVAPDVPVTVRYWADCRQKQHWRTEKYKVKTRSRRIEIEMPWDRPGLCLLPDECRLPRP